MLPCAVYIIGCNYTAMVTKKISSLAYTSLAHFTNDGNFLLFPVLINYYQSLNAQFGILAAGAVLYDLVSGLLGSWVGKLADRTGAYGKLICVGIATQGIAVAVFGSAFIFPAFTDYIVITGAVILGFGQAFYHPLGGTVLSYNFKGAGFGRALGINGSIGSVGRAVVPAVIGVAIASIGVSDAFFALALYEVVIGFLILNGLKWFTRKETAPSGTDGKPERPESLVRRYRAIIYTLALVVFVRSIFTSGVVTFVPYYIGNIFNLPYYSALPNEIISIAFIAPIFGQPLFGVMTAKLGGKFSITFSSVFSVIFIVLFMLTHSVYFMTASLAGFAFSVFSGFPVLMGYVSQLVPKDILTASSGLVWGMGSTFGGAVGVVMFYVMHGVVHLDVSYSMWSLIIVGFIAVLMIPLLPRRDIDHENELAAG